VNHVISAAIGGWLAGMRYEHKKRRTDQIARRTDWMDGWKDR